MKLTIIQKTFIISNYISNILYNEINHMIYFYTFPFRILLIKKKSPKVFLKLEEISKSKRNH